MKNFLIASAAVLIGAGAALAQDVKPAPPPADAAAPPTSDATPAPDLSATAATTTALASPMPANTTLVGDMSSANPPPAAGSYPPCHHKGQDRCVVTAQIKHRTATRSGA